MRSSGGNFPTGRDEGIQVLRRAAAALDEIAA
ncbi:MAG: IclR family transcriptional regulator, partial [Mycobacterium sp.]